MKDSEKVSVLERLRRMLDIPADAIGGASHIEVFGYCELEVSGCTGLEEYSDTRIVLLICDGSLTVEGKGLELSSFSEGFIRVNGRLDVIAFGKREKRGG